MKKINEGDRVLDPLFVISKRPPAENSIKLKVKTREKDERKRKDPKRS